MVDGGSVAIVLLAIASLILTMKVLALYLRARVRDQIFIRSVMSDDPLSRGLVGRGMLIPTRNEARDRQQRDPPAPLVA